MTDIVFMGSPEFAVPVLRNLVDQYKIVGVVTQPDRPAGRGCVLTPPPIKNLAIDLQLPFIQPRKLSEPESMAQLKLWSPDLIVVAAFGQILRKDVLDLTRYGCINVHASLLPRWRGAAPIQASILNGDEETGITIMCMDPGIDTGPILCQRAIPITEQDIASTLSSRLSRLGADLLLETLPAYLSGDLVPQPQDESLATYAPMIKKDDGFLDFTLTAIDLERKIRAFNPWPGAYTYWKSQPLKIHQAHVINLGSTPPGKHIIYNDLPAVVTGKGILVIDQLQPAGKKILTGKEFMSGARHWGD